MTDESQEYQESQLFSVCPPKGQNPLRLLRLLILFIIEKTFSTKNTNKTLEIRVSS